MKIIRKFNEEEDIVSYSDRIVGTIFRSRKDYSEKFECISSSPVENQVQLENITSGEIKILTYNELKKYYEGNMKIIRRFNEAIDAETQKIILEFKKAIKDLNLEIQFQSLLNGFRVDNKF